MKSNIIKTISRGACTLAILAMASCARETLDGNQPKPTDVPEGMVRVGLYTDAGDYQVPVSRAAADEGLDPVSMPWVFVFLGTDNNATFLEVKQAELVGALPYITLTQQPSPVRLLIVVNAPAMFSDRMSTPGFTATDLAAKLDGATFAQAVNDILNTVDLSPSGVPYEGAYIPMSGVTDLPRIDRNTTIGTSASTVKLRRIVAKVTIENSASGFALAAASAVGAKRYGRFYQTAPVRYIAGNTVNYAPDIVTALGPASAENTLSDPIYLYESAAGETSVIVSGEYEGSTYYYRLAFRDTGDDQVILPVERNKWYKFKITSVTARGADSFAGAVAALPSNIKYEITVVDQTSYDMADNGFYYIGLSNSDYLIYGAVAASEVFTVATVTTDATSGMVAPAINSITVSGAGFELVSQAYVSLSPNGAGAEATDIVIRATSTDASGTITIRLGNLTKTIAVTQVSSTLSASGQATEMNYHGSDQYTSATIAESDAYWLSISNDGIQSTGYTGFTQPDAAHFLPIYIIAAENYSSARRTEEIYLTRKDGGCVKVCMIQEAGL